MSLDPITEIRSRLSIEDVVAPYVQLKKAGRSFKACCPFHHEKTPSFVVSPDKQLAYCFGCHKGGDIFKFIQEIEGIDFREALELLAEKANVELKTFHPKGGNIVTKDEKDILAELQGELADFYAQNLFNITEGQKVLEYLHGRGLTDETIKEFKLGFARDSFGGAYEHLLDKGFKKSDAVKAGVLISKDTTTENVYDRFRLRLMFPIFDDRGRVVGFGGRALKKDEQPKYLNSPESSVYHKGNILYGMNFAKPHIREKDFVVVVEGYMDLISSYQAGVKNVVASSGTALTKEQLKLIKRYTKNLVFSFDTDEAGLEALTRAIENAQPMDFNIKVLLVPDGHKDPDECAKASPEKWRNAVLDAIPYLDFFLENWASKYDLSKIEDSKTYCDFYLKILRKVEHPLERDSYLKKLAKKLATPEYQLKERMGQLDRDYRRLERKTDDVEKKDSISAGEYFVGFIMQFKNRFAEHVKADYEMFFEGDLRNIYARMASYYIEHGCIDDGLVSEMSEVEKEKLQVYALYVENKVADWDETDILSEFKRVFEKLKKDFTKSKQKELIAKIRQAEMNNDLDLEGKLMEEYTKSIS
ncbi:DNA primase [Candidatus Peregrinibacteria bacterium RIFOXYC2_FULL_41_22]|nr:MAG: DNA primase [Candidatus Peregrinibacteria bacterium RIFOXYC2_FULL_41_22]